MRFTEGGLLFNVTNFIWEEIIEVENDSRKGLPYAPYIMYIIEKVSGISFKKDMEHPMLKITRLLVARVVGQRVLVGGFGKLCLDFTRSKLRMFMRYGRTSMRSA